MTLRAREVAEGFPRAPDAVVTSAASGGDGCRDRPKRPRRRCEHIGCRRSAPGRKGAICDAAGDHVATTPRPRKFGAIFLRASDAKRRRKETAKKAARIDSAALDATKGRVNIRLDHSVLHMPEPSANEKSAVCQLHRWAHRKKTGKHGIPKGHAQV